MVKANQLLQIKHQLVCIVLVEHLRQYFGFNLGHSERRWPGLPTTKEWCHAEWFWIVRLEKLHEISMQREKERKQQPPPSMNLGPQSIVTSPIFVFAEDDSRGRKNWRQRRGRNKESIARGIEHSRHLSSLISSIPSFLHAFQHSNTQIHKSTSSPVHRNRAKQILAIVF